MQTRFPIDTETDFRRLLHRFVGVIVVVTSSALALFVLNWISAK